MCCRRSDWFIVIWVYSEYAGKEEELWIGEAGKQVGKEVQTSIKAHRKIRKEIEGCKERLSNTMTASVRKEERE